MSDLILVSDRNLDEWEDYIRDSSAANAILEHGKRWYEFYRRCQAEHGKQGGSLFSEFAEERFGLSNSAASHWAIIGKNYDELRCIATKFSSDYTAIYEYTTLTQEQKTLLLDSGEIIDRGYIKEVKYGHEEGDEWYTPKWLFDALGITYSIDVCAPEDLTYVVTPTEKFFNEHDNGLIQAWHGTIWCNPPYSKSEPWALQCIEHNDGLLLTHIPANAEWCCKVWEACKGIRLFQAIEFIRPDGKAQRPGYWLQLTAFGDVAANALIKMVIPTDLNPRRIPSPMWFRGNDAG